MCRRAGFRNRNNVATANGPGECNGGRRAAVCGANLRERVVTYQEVIGAAQRRIRHHRHTVLLAPGQKVTLNAAVNETVRDLIGCAAMAVWDSEKIFHLTNVEV